MGDFCKGFDVECAGFADNYWDYFDVCLQRSVCQEGSFEWFMNGVDVLNNGCDVPIC